jgi:hypothetical protein
MQPIIIKYNGGKFNIEIKQFNQQINVCKNQKVDGNSCIVNNTCWYKGMIQTIKPGDCNYYLMSENDFINMEESQTTTEYTNQTLVIQIINISIDRNQTNQIEQLKSENTNILQNPTKIKNNIYVELL